VPEEAPDQPKAQPETPPVPVPGSEASPAVADAATTPNDAGVPDPKLAEPLPDGTQPTVLTTAGKGSPKSTTPLGKPHWALFTARPTLLAQPSLL
jgi:hypothetical protein